MERRVLIFLNNEALWRFMSSKEGDQIFQKKVM